MSDTRASLVMLPVATTLRRAREQVAVPEVPVLGDDDPALLVRHLSDLAVGRAVPVGQFDRMQGVVARSVQELREPGWQLRADQELHAAVSGTVRPPAARAPNSKAARMSSRSRSE